MSEITLTKNEAFTAVCQGMSDWESAGRPRNKAMWYEQQAICRAQVRKVVKWLETSDYSIIQTRTLQALREAAGGEG